MADTAPAPSTAGAELRRVRRARGLTARALAARLGVHEGALGRWERGARRPPPARLAAWLDALGADRAARRRVAALLPPTLGQHLRRRRGELRVFQATLAAAVGLSPAQLSTSRTDRGCRI
jgi:DNA-binding XRE family transcriptional regulator